MTASVKARAIALVERTSGGLVASTGALLLGVSWATASSTLARLYWAGVINRHKDGRAFVYTARVAKGIDAAA
jgi:Mn-dependent DtxR family transcriptional regulator